MKKTDLGKTNKKNARTHTYVVLKKRRKNKSAHERLAD